MWDRQAKAFAALACAAVVALTVEGFLLFARGTAAPAAIPVPPPPSPSPSPTPARHVAPPLLSPFTGEPVKSLRRVLAVKIGNTLPERPATGLSKADIVYLIPVEGGLSRIMAIFSSHYPRVVGPVRSARQDDIKLLRQFGRPAFVWSGAQPRLLPVVEHSRIVDLYAGIASDRRRLLPQPRPGRAVQPLRPHQTAAQGRPERKRGPQHRVQVRAAAARRAPQKVGGGVLPGRVVPVHLVTRRGPLGGIDGRLTRLHHRTGAAAVRPHGGHPAHRRRAVPLP